MVLGIGHSSEDVTFPYTSKALLLSQNPTFLCFSGMIQGNFDAVVGEPRILEQSKVRFVTVCGREREGTKNIK
jgi:hypothetical protein